MEFGIKNKIDWQYVGSLLANEGDEEQAEFFKAFCKECKSWGTNYQVEFQLASVNSKLTTEEKQILGMIGYENENI